MCRPQCLFERSNPDEQIFSTTLVVGYFCYYNGCLLFVYFENEFVYARRMYWFASSIIAGKQKYLWKRNEFILRTFSKKRIKSEHGIEYCSFCSCIRLRLYHF